MNIDTLLRGHPREIAVEAAYYAVRELKQSSVPAESHKEHFQDAKGSEPTPAGMELSRAIISLIEKTEEIDLDHLSKDRSDHYISELTTTVMQLSRKELKLDEERGRMLLDKLRQS
jgi:hypothetical protein